MYIDVLRSSRTSFPMIGFAASGCHSTGARGTGFDVRTVKLRLTGTPPAHKSFERPVHHRYPRRALRPPPVRPQAPLIHLLHGISGAPRWQLLPPERARCGIAARFSAPNPPSEQSSAEITHT